MSTTVDERQAAQRRVADLIELARSLAPAQHAMQIVQEAEALNRAIAAFHLEAIRFRMYNVDRLVTHSPILLPVEAAQAVADARHHLEAAGFHTRSH